MVTTQVDFYLQIALERNVPHVARNVWLSCFQMFVLFEVVINESTFLLSKQRAVHCIFNENEHRTHTLTSNVRYIAFPMKTSTVLTHLTS